MSDVTVPFTEDIEWTGPKTFTAPCDGTFEINGVLKKMKKGDIHYLESESVK